MSDSLRVCYISLESGVISDNLGGKTHIEGILEALDSEYNITLAACDADQIENDCKKISLRSNQVGFYIDIFKIFSKNNYDVFLFRKTLIGLYAITIFKIILLMIGKRRCCIYEFNGISGDFIVSNRFLKKSLEFLNLLPLLFSDAVYAVNNNIANRIKKNHFLRSLPVVVCENGCFNFVSSWDFPLIKIDSNKLKTSFFFFGANQSKYHLKWFLNLLYKSDAPTDYDLHFVGDDFSDLSYSHKIFSPGSMSPMQFVDYVSKNRTSRSWGIVPLDYLHEGNDIIPIKAMDYISACLPIIHSDACLSKFTNRSGTISYSVSDEQSLSKVFESISRSDFDYQRAIADIKILNTSEQWSVKLKPLCALINKLCSQN